MENNGPIGFMGLRQQAGFPVAVPNSPPRWLSECCVWSGLASEGLSELLKSFRSQPCAIGSLLCWYVLHDQKGNARLRVSRFSCPSTIRNWPRRSVPFVSLFPAIFPAF